MKTIFFYDTETTGLPEWKIPSDDPTQPHLVQFAGILANEDTREIISTVNVIIRADDWDIPQVTIDVHGITKEISQAYGIDEKIAIEMILDLGANTRRVAFNKTFDQRIIRIGAMRYSDHEKIDRWHSKDDHSCAMRMAREIMGGKQPKLIEAYEHFMGEKFENAHDALADTKACMAVYWAALDAGATK